MLEGGDNGVRGEKADYGGVGHRGRCQLAFGFCRCVVVVEGSGHDPGGAGLDL